MSFEIVAYGDNPGSLSLGREEFLNDPNFEHEIVWFTARSICGTKTGVCCCVYKTDHPLSTEELKQKFGPNIKDKHTFKFSEIYNMKGFEQL